MKNLILTLTNTGITAHLVGGIVRDALLAEQRGQALPTGGDLDLLLTHPTATAAELSALIERTLTGYRVDAVGKAFGILKVVDEDGQDYDLAFPRTEISTGLGYADFDVTSDPALPVEADLARRDFTMNAVAQCALTDALVDPFGGAQDLRAGVIRAVGEAHARFTEDPTRILRAAGFIARFGFTPDADLEAAAAALAPTLLPTLPAERIFKEFHNPLKPGKTILSGPHAAQALAFLARTGALGAIMPEFQATVGFEQCNPHHHATVDTHLLNVAAYAAALGGRPEAVMAALLHDIGKPGTFNLVDGRGTFYGHEDLGATIARDILTRLKAPTAFTQDVVTAITLHMQPGRATTERAARRLAVKAGGALDTLLTLFVADRADHTAGDDAQGQAAFIRASMGTLSATFTQRDLALKGDTLAALGLRGQAIGTVKDTLASLVVDGLLPNEHGALLAHTRQHLL